MKRPAAKRLVARLEAKFPCLYPVTLRVYKKKVSDSTSTYYGWTEVRRHRGSDVLCISIWATLNDIAAYELILHEFAHCMTWRPDHINSSVEHDPEFGISYARVCTYLADEPSVWP